MRISSDKSKIGLKNGLASVRRCLQRSKHCRGVHKRTHPRTAPIPVPTSIRMNPKKKKKKSETHPMQAKKTPLLMRRCTPKEPGRGRAKIPLSKMKKPWSSPIGRSRRLANPKYWA